MRIIRTFGITQDGTRYEGWLVCGHVVALTIESAADLLFTDYPIEDLS